MRSIATKAARMLGLEVTRYRVATSSMARLQRILAHHGVDLVLDVGANSGQFASGIRSGGYRGRIVSFEPLTAAHHTLLRKSRRDALWTVVPPMAIGATDSTIQINVAKNSFSSSILSVLDSHIRAEEGAAFVRQETVRLARLDSVAVPYLRESKSAFLKVDTQGYEDQVLAGAGESLRLLIGVQLELSLVALYEGQPLFMDLVERMREAGFALCGVVPGFTDEQTGRLLQFDGVFLRNSSLAVAL